MDHHGARSRTRDRPRFDCVRHHHQVRLRQPSWQGVLFPRSPGTFMFRATEGDVFSATTELADTCRTGTAADRVTIVAIARVVPT